MKLAWFGPSRLAPVAAPLTAALAALPGAANRLETFDAASAHEFVWKHLREPYDLCFYELADTAAYAFVLGYLFHYPGVLVLHDRGDAHHAIVASKMVLAAGASTAPLQQDYPDLVVRPLPLGAPDVETVVSASHPDVRFVVLGPTGSTLVERAVARARAAGAPATLVRPTSSVAVAAERLVADADAVIALRWPAPAAALPDAVVAMSAGKPVIVFEMEATGAWPALDPQTWQPRGYGASADPIVVSIDPRDEEHSLMLAIRRLSVDADLRASLGAAARRWWRDHATVAMAAAAWRSIVTEAHRLPPPRTLLPPDLTADGTQRTRELLAPFGVAVDMLD